MRNRLALPSLRLARQAKAVKLRPSPARLVHPARLEALLPSPEHLALPRHLVPAARAPETTPTPPARACLARVVARGAAGERVPPVALDKAANVLRVHLAHRAHVPAALVPLAVALLPQVTVRVRTRE